MIENPHYEISVDKGPKGDKGDPGPAGTFTTPTADVSFGNHRITNLGIPRDGTDAVNKNYADSRYIRAGDALNKNYADNRYLHFNPNVDMRGRRITNMDAPTNPADAATKAFVERYNPPLKTKTLATNLALETGTRAVFSFNNGFLNANPREVYFIWFSLRYSGDSRPRIVFHPFSVGTNEEVVGQVDAVDYIIYSHNSQYLHIQRGGSNPATLKEIGIIYVNI